LHYFSYGGFFGVTKRVWIIATVKIKTNKNLLQFLLNKKEKNLMFFSFYDSDSTIQFYK